jgi:DNA-binding transcriptional LysR family regulator
VDLRRLRYFAVLAQELHFGRAAERLQIAQPGLSQQIKILEREIGAELFVRSAHGVSLTQAGLVLLQDGVPLIGQLDRVAQRAAATAAPGRDELAVVHTRSLSGGLPDEVLRVYRRRHPRTAVRLESAWTARNVEMLRAGEVDVAFVRLPLSDPGELNVLSLGHTEMAAAVPHDHPLARRRALDVDDLRGLSVVLWPRQQAPGYFDSLVRQVWGAEPPEVALWEPDPEHILAAVAAGVGVSVLDRDRARTLRPPGVSVRRFRTPPTAEYGIAWTAHTEGTPVAAFVDACREVAAAASGAVRPH